MCAIMNLVVQMANVKNPRVIQRHHTVCLCEMCVFKVAGFFRPNSKMLGFSVLVPKRPMTQWCFEHTCWLVAVREHPLSVYLRVGVWEHPLSVRLRVGGCAGTILRVS